MCGIVGYVGKKRVVPVILDGLKRLEYRGYDSAGIAVAGNGEGLQIRRAEGKLRNLEEAIRLKPLDGTYGIGHTRWATHGRPTEENAHPHRDCTGRDRGGAQRHRRELPALKRKLREEGHRFSTETDTEVIAHLVEKYSAAGQRRPQVPLEEAVRKTVKQLAGVFALAVISADEPNKIVAARNGPPAVIGLGKDEYFVASDVPAILYHTRDLFFLADGDLAVITPSGRAAERLSTASPWSARCSISPGTPSWRKRAASSISCSRKSTSSRGPCATPHWAESRSTAARCFWTRWRSPRPSSSATKVRSWPAAPRWHAAWLAKFMIERLARVPVEVDYGSEFRYRDPIMGPDSLTMVITQSGETADTIAAQREAKDKGSKTLAICNVVGAMVTREAQGTIYTHAGPEIGVASTKAFTAQLTALFLFALYLAAARGAFRGAGRASCWS